MHCDVEQVQLEAGDWTASGLLSSSHLVASSTLNIKLKVRLQWISAQLPRTNTQLLCVQLNLLSMEKAGGRGGSHLSCHISSVITSLPVMLFVLCCRYLRKTKTKQEKKNSYDAWTPTTGSISASASMHNTCTCACFRYLQILPLFYDYQSWLFSYGASVQGCLTFARGQRRLFNLNTTESEMNQTRRQGSGHLLHPALHVSLSFFSTFVFLGLCNFCFVYFSGAMWAAAQAEEMVTRHCRLTILIEKDDDRWRNNKAVYEQRKG